MMTCKLIATERYPDFICSLNDYMTAGGGDDEDGDGAGDGDGAED